jgi:hypothetical protein
MAGSLLRAGHDVTAFNRTPSKAQGLIDRGARMAARVADACWGMPSSPCSQTTSKSPRAARGDLLVVAERASAVSNHCMRGKSRRGGSSPSGGNRAKITWLNPLLGGASWSRLPSRATLCATPGFAAGN